MGPKKEKKEKKEKKKKEKKKPKKVLKSDYLAKIADRNAELAAARNRIQKIEDIYYDTQKRYEQTQEDSADIIKYLQHEIEENELEIEAFDAKIEIHKEEIAKNDKYYLPILAKLETEYEAKEKELHDQLQQNMAKLSAFEEVRQQRDEYLKKKEQMYQKIKEMEAFHEEEIYKFYEENKQDAKQMEIKHNINKLITDFRKATDTAIIINTNKLIRDNIALGNTLTCTQDIFERARDSFQKIHELEKQYRYNAELLQEEHHMAMKKYIKQVNCIENLLESHKELFEKIKRSEKLIPENRRLRREIAETECILKEKDAELSYLQKVLKEHKETFSVTKYIFNVSRKNVFDLEMCLYETAKRVKHGIDVENLTTLMDEKGLPLDMAEEEHKETLKEFKYKTRETVIDETIEILKNRLLSDTEMQLMASSSEFNQESNNASATSDFGLERLSSLG